MEKHFADYYEGKFDDNDEATSRLSRAQGQIVMGMRRRAIALFQFVRIIDSTDNNRCAGCDVHAMAKKFDVDHGFALAVLFAAVARGQAGNGGGDDERLAMPRPRAVLKSTRTACCD
jgi:hypothetical protein